MLTLLVKLYYGGFVLVFKLLRLLFAFLHPQQLSCIVFSLHLLLLTHIDSLLQFPHDQLVWNLRVSQALRLDLIDYPLHSL